METIEDICKLYGVKSFVTDDNNLIGIRVKRGYVWHRYYLRHKQYMVCGTTKARGKATTHHA